MGFVGDRSARKPNSGTAYRSFLRSWAHWGQVSASSSKEDSKKWHTVQSAYQPETRSLFGSR